MSSIGHAEQSHTLSPLAPAPDKSRVGPIGHLRRAWVRVLSPARYDRLDGSLRVARVEIERRSDPDATDAFLSSLPPDLVPRPGWKAAALSLLSEARVALACGKIDQGWKLLHAARRMEIFGLGAELPAYTTVLRAESEKMSSWRRNAIQAIVGTAEKPVAAAEEAVFAAAIIRDEHYNNGGYKDQLIRTQVLFLALILVTVVTTVMAKLYWDVLPLAQEAISPATRPTPTFYAFFGVMLFGYLGATISAMLRTSNTSTSARIPEITSANHVTFMRILMGGASAIVIHLVLQSQLPGIFNQQFAQTLTTLKPHTFYIVAFVAGFSERLVLRTVEYVAGKNTGDTQDKGTPKPV